MKSYGKNTINLLNESVETFYSYQSEYADNKKVIEFKAMFVTYMNQLERVFNGVFGKAFQIDGEDDIRLFKEMWPVMYRAATRVYGNEGLVKLCYILRNFRNLNAHAFCECKYEIELDASYILKELPNESNEVRYLTDNDSPTLAGMISLLFFLSNDKMVSYFIASDIWNGFVEKLNYFGGDYKPNVHSFPEEMMKVAEVNDEIDIRSSADCDDIIHAIFGRFTDKVSKERGEYIYHNGEEYEDSTYHVTLTITDGCFGNFILCVTKGSNYGCYFSDNYILNIKDISHFIEWCNKVPPFMFVLFLFRLKINEYDASTLTSQQQKLLLKLNKPKFYVDKNVDILLLSDSISDLRMGSQIVSIGVNYCLYMFEMVNYRRKSLNYFCYSSLRNAMKRWHLPDNVIERIVAIRNFFSHYYILGDEHVVGSGAAKININFIVNAFRDFHNELELEDPYKAKALFNDFYYRVICNVLLFKYADAVRKTEAFLNDPTQKTYVPVPKTMKRIEHSFFTQENEVLVKSIYGNCTFNLYKRTTSSLSKCTIEITTPITLNDGFEIKKDLSFITVDEIVPSLFLGSPSYSFVSKQDIGFVFETVWKTSER